MVRMAVTEAAAAADRLTPFDVSISAVAAAPFVDVPAIRAGFAYLVAELVAGGTSELRGVHYLERGYSDLVGRLGALGVRVDAVS